MYQLSMAYAYFRSGRHDDTSSFELFFRTPPFDGEFTIFAGLDEVLSHVAHFSFSDSDIAYLKSIMPDASDAFWDYLGSLDCSEVRILAQTQGSVVFPRVPLMRIEGPLGVCQLLETTLLTLVNYPSLVCTNAKRMRLAAGPKAVLLEFGLRRAQGPDGGFSASKYCMIGGFDGTSNVTAGMKLPGVDVKGTHAHAFVQTFSSLDEILEPTEGPLATLKAKVLEYVRRILSPLSSPSHPPPKPTNRYRAKLDMLKTNDGELAAFISYALAFPDGFLALIDTYESLSSGCLNFILVALALDDLGYTPRGIRLDSGDLAYISHECRALFTRCVCPPPPPPPHPPHPLTPPPLTPLTPLAPTQVRHLPLPGLLRKPGHRGLERHQRERAALAGEGAALHHLLRDRDQPGDVPEAAGARLRVQARRDQRAAAHQAVAGHQQGAHPGTEAGVRASEGSAGLQGGLEGPASAGSLAPARRRQKRMAGGAGGCSERCSFCPA
jgi:putative nicotinate phosphoribosyltransferase